MRSAARVQQTLPMGDQTRQGVLLDGFDFFAEFCEGFAPNLAKDFGIAPLAMKPARTEAAFEYPSLDGELSQGVFDHCGVERESIGDIRLRKWAMRAAEAANKFQHGLCDRFNERGG